MSLGPDEAEDLDGIPKTTPEEWRRIAVDPKRGDVLIRDGLIIGVCHVLGGIVLYQLGERRAWMTLLEWRRWAGRGKIEEPAWHTEKEG